MFMRIVIEGKENQGVFGGLLAATRWQQSFLPVAVFFGIV
jgi:hypothetical protein